MDTDDNNEDEMTDLEVTDSEDEARVANECGDSGKKMETKKITKHMSKKDKKAKVGANAHKQK